MLGGVSDSCPLSVAIVLCQSVEFFAVLVMVHCKNVGDGPDDDERRPLRLTEKEKGKGPKKTTSKKRKRGDIVTAIAVVVAPLL